MMRRLGWKKRIKRARNYVRHQYFLNTAKPSFPFDAVFVIGMPKTGTSSTKAVLEAAGSRHLTIYHPVTDHWERGDYEYLDRVMQHFNSFDDKPWNRLDVVERSMRASADHRFVLTTRDADDWFESLQRYSIMVGRAAPSEEVRMASIDAYRRHYNECRELAVRYSRDLLEVDVTRDADAVSRLSGFLGIHIPLSEFPHVNRTV